MIAVGSLGEARSAYVRIKAHEFYCRATHKQILEAGEPFLISKDPHTHGVPLIKLFGPGYCWRVKQESFLIVGEGMDSLHDSYSEMRQIYELRRKGDIWGKWFSEHCLAGEIGIRSFAEVEYISREVYDQILFKFQDLRLKNECQR